MSIERTGGLGWRAAAHAALADPARLRIIDTLGFGDVSPSELAIALGVTSNLLAHHLNVLEGVGLITRGRSEGDRRRTYVRLVPGALDAMTPGVVRGAPRVLFVCTANSARSHLAAALWRQSSAIPATSAGTRPADRLHPGAIATATRHCLPLRRSRPQRIDDVRIEGDLVITVCDLAHEDLGGRADLHWSVPDPARTGSDAAFDLALEELTRRVKSLAPRLFRPVTEAQR